MQYQPIIPAIIPETYEQLSERLGQLRQVVRRVQVDVMDGSYTQHSCWPYVGVNAGDFVGKENQNESLPFHDTYDYEIDMLLLHPEQHLHAWSLAGAMAVIVHVETVSDIEEILRSADKYRIELGVAIKPSTDIEMLAPYAQRASFFQCMGNDFVGESGMRLKETVYEKIRAIKKRWPNVSVGVDIGVNEETLPALVAAGAERFAVGSAVFGAGGDAPSAVLLLERLSGLQEKTQKSIAENEG